MYWTVTIIQNNNIFSDYVKYLGLHFIKQMQQMDTSHKVDKTTIWLKSEKIQVAYFEKVNIMSLKKLLIYKRLLESIWVNRCKVWNLENIFLMKETIFIKFCRCTVDNLLLIQREIPLLHISYDKKKEFIMPYKRITSLRFIT